VRGVGSEGGDRRSSELRKIKGKGRVRKGRSARAKIFGDPDRSARLIKDTLLRGKGDSKKCRQSAIPAGGHREKKASQLKEGRRETSSCRLIGSEQALIEGQCNRSRDGSKNVGYIKFKVESGVKRESVDE